MSVTTPVSTPTLLLVGASRGLGLAMAREFLKRGWHVIATVRGPRPTPLHALLPARAGDLEIESLDMNDLSQVEELRQRLAARRLDMVFVNAGVTTAEQNRHIGLTEPDEFTRVMLTNALSPMRVIETFQDLVPSDGLIGVMSSRQGSVGNNTHGLRELYRGSKAALNQFMRCFAAREGGWPRAMALMAPGWVRTDMGGEEAPLGIEDSIPSLVRVLCEKRGRAGLEYLDYRGRTVPW